MALAVGNVPPRLQAVVMAGEFVVVERAVPKQAYVLRILQARTFDSPRPGPSARASTTTSSPTRHVPRREHIPILGLRLELLPRSRRREAVELLAEAFWGNRRHFRMVLRRLKPFEECQVRRAVVVVAFVLARARRRLGSADSSCTRFIAALLELAAFHSFHSMIFTATLGERGSVPFWIANKAAHFSDKKFVSIVLQNSYTFAAGSRYAASSNRLRFCSPTDLRLCRNQSPIFAADDSTPPMGYSVRNTLRAKNLTELCACLLRIFRASTIPEICALRDKFPIHYFKAETRIEDVMNSVVEARVDSRGRTRAAAAKQRASEGVSQTDPWRPVSREPGPNAEVRPERPHGVFVYVVDGRRARLLTEVCSHSSPCKTFSPQLQMLARLQEMGFVVEKTITGDVCYVGPDGIAYPSVVEAAAAVGAPQTVAGLFIVLAHYTLVPRANELELLPLAREQQQIRSTITSAIVRASAGQTNTTSLSCLTDSQRIICGKPPEGGKGEFFACSAYLIDTYSNDGRRGLCSNGAHIFLP
ncbi:hypothetical protein CTAYLR_007713 [Chrysophaeum taylorii]|uniref:Uncharacterized protein n=1 Tax=Chrysophaeum taylorii TaxID=2483200 RepID=A0AAD7UMT5_9STRA|nr:hypothetical protein CTAYLR_007713 [Chrysophaeum taylorii]